MNANGRDISDAVERVPTGEGDLARGRDDFHIIRDQIHFVGGNPTVGTPIFDQFAGRTFSQTGKREKPSSFAASRRRLSVATISVSPDTRAEARCRASKVRMGNGGVRR